MKASAVLTWVAILGLGGACAGLGWWLGQRYQASNLPALPPGLVVVEAGQRVPPLLLPDLHTGKLQPLSEPGRPRLINWWASWCGPCVKEMPLLAAFAREQGGNGVEVVGIALDDSDAAKAFLIETPAQFTHLLEAPGQGDSSVWLGNRRGLLPFTALVDAEGRLVKTHTGPFASVEDIQAWADSR